MNKLKQLTETFVKTIYAAEVQKEWYTCLSNYFEEIAKLKPSYKTLCDNPREAMIWYGAKMTYLMVTVECNLAEKSITNDCLEMASNIVVKELRLLVDCYHDELIERN